MCCTRSGEQCVPNCDVGKLAAIRGVDLRGPVYQSGPLLIATKGEQVTTGGLLKLLRKGLQELGVADVHLFGLHSERIGGTSARLAVGTMESHRRSLSALRSYVRVSSSTTTVDQAVQARIRQGAGPIYMPVQVCRDARARLCSHADQERLWDCPWPPPAWEQTSCSRSFEWPERPG